MIELIPSFIPPLLADLGDIVGLLIMLGVMAFSFLSKVLSGQQGPGAGQPRPPHPPGQPIPPGQPPKQRPAGGLEAEIEDFLRQVRGEPAPPRPPQSSVESVLPPQPPPRRPKPTQVLPELAQAEDDFVPGDGFGEGVSSHVREHLSGDTIANRDSHLGEYVGETDERVEQRLEQVFDHDVGHLEHRELVDTSIAEGTDATDVHSQTGNKKPEDERAAAKIRKMLSQPESIRDVFVAAEILKRPEI